jgi:hypothetical protein
MQSLKAVDSHLTNKKKELKSFLEYVNANNLYKLKILVKIKMTNRRSNNSRLAIRRNLTKILDTWISINKKKIKKIYVALFIELNLK